MSAAAGFGFHALLDPAPALGVGNVHELHADAAAINAPRFARPLVVDLTIKLKIGMRLRRQQPERIQFGLEISKLPKESKDTFAFVIVNDYRSCGPCSRFELKSP